MPAHTTGNAVITTVKRVQTIVAMIAAAIIVVTTTADVVLRYGWGRPIHGAYDVVECMLVLFVFHGVAAVFFERSNITIDLVDHLVGLRTRFALIRFADLVSIAALFLMTWAMISPALQAFDYKDRKLELGLPLWVVWLFALTGIVGTILCAIGALAKSGRHGPHDEGNVE